MATDVAPPPTLPSRGPARRPGRAARRWSPRTPAVLLLVAWVVAGAWGAYGYVHRYALYRGFPPPRIAPGVPTGTTREVWTWSPALHARVAYLIHLPAGYARMAAAGRRFPVLYVLHGHPGLARNILEAGDIGTDLDTLVHVHATRPMIVVLPEVTTGPLGGADTEWADTRFGHYDQVLVDVVHAVDRRFASVPSRSARVIAGLSSGAYGAVNVGLHHLAIFGGIQSWSGYEVQDPQGVFAGASPAELAANSPADYAGRLARRIRALGLHVYLYVGRSDSVPLLAELPPFVSALRRDGAEVSAAEFPGGHDWALWRHEMPMMLRVAGHWFTHPARALAPQSAAARRAQARQLGAFERAAQLRRRAVIAKLRRRGIAHPEWFARHPQVLIHLRRHGRLPLARRVLRAERPRAAVGPVRERARAARTSGPCRWGCAAARR